MGSIAKTSGKVASHSPGGPATATGNAAVFVVIPAYNEARALRQTVAPLVAEGYSIVVVDDGSGDRPAECLAGLPVVVLRHAVNLGQGAALQTGMDYAYRRGAAAVVHFDADGQHSSDEIPSLLAPIRSGVADVALGSRFLRSSDSSRVPVGRRIMLRVGVIVSATFTGLWLSDTHNGFRALSRRTLEHIQLRENRFAHASEILDQIRRKRIPYVEVPTTVNYTEYSRTKGQSSWNSVNILIDLLLDKLFR
jgi:polyprenyl-phospho-N-acetylgalactosaminyl synthase